MGFYLTDTTDTVPAIRPRTATPRLTGKTAYTPRFRGGLSQGREYSWKVGLYYFRARWYDPVTGRWLSNDPIGISGGLNQYVFCGNNPVNFRDPSGLCTESSDDVLPYVSTDNPWLWVPATIANSVPFTVNALHQVFRPIDWNDQSAPYFAVLSVLGPEIQIAKGVGLAAKNVGGVADSVATWLGRGGRVIKNDAGDSIFLSENGLRRVRFDINRPFPHRSPHGHVEEFVNGKWNKSGPVYPKDVPHN